MYKNILIAVALDHSRDDTKAMDVAHALADEGATLTALNVVEDIPAHIAGQIPEQFLKNRHKEAEAALKAELGGVGGVKAEVIHGHPGRALVDYAAKHEVDCIIISSHRPGLQDYFLGSTATRVIRHAQCAVHVLR